MSKFITNSFQVPNAFVDLMLDKVSGNACKIYLIIVRKTRGWQKESDRISYTQLLKISGIGSFSTIEKAINELLEIGLINVKTGNVKTSNEYSLNDNFCSTTETVVGKCTTETVVATTETVAEGTTETVDTITTIKTTNKKTNSVTPKTKAEPKEKTSLEKLIERGCDEQLAKDFIAHRKTKKSAITDTALNLISSQAEIAGIEFSKAIEICIARNWVSFNASWKWQDETTVAQYQVPTNFNAPEDTHVPVMTDYERDENGLPVFTPIDWSDVLAEVDGSRAS